jgi:hypothetical protein
MSNDYPAREYSAAKENRIWKADHDWILDRALSLPLPLDIS